MTNFKLYGRPDIKVRSIAAWDRLLADYDMLIRNTPGCLGFWPLNDLDPAEFGNYDGLILPLDGLLGYWKLDALTLVSVSALDVKILLDGPTGYWKMTTMKDTTVDTYDNTVIGDSPTGFWKFNTIV